MHRSGLKVKHTDFSGKDEDRDAKAVSETEVAARQCRLTLLSECERKKANSRRLRACLALLLLQACDPEAAPNPSSRRITLPLSQFRNRVRSVSLRFPSSSRWN